MTYVIFVISHVKTGTNFDLKQEGPKLPTVPVILSQVASDDLDNDARVIE